MEINRRIGVILKDFNIDIDSGLLVLIGIYYNLNVDKVCPEEIIKAINITKIVEKDYRSVGGLRWNIPLFEGQETEWDWVFNWNEKWRTINDNRRDNLADVTKRMIEFFQKYPKYRRDDVFKARDAYMMTVRDPEFLKSSAKFIFEGSGSKKTSMLLTWCEKVAVGGTGKDYGQQKGSIL